MKKIHEENEDFCEEEYFNFESLILSEEETFRKNFWAMRKLKIDFQKIFVKASLLNLENSGFCPIFLPNSSYKYTHILIH